MEVKADELSCAKCDIFKMQQSNGLLLHDKEKWKETEELEGTIWDSWEIPTLVPVCLI